MNQHLHHSAGALVYLPCAAVLLLFPLYLWLVFRQRQSGYSWPAFRIVSFASGVVLLAAALFPAMHGLSLTDIRAHMWQHLWIGMFAPLGLVFGAPLTLFLRSFPKRWSRRCALILHSGPMRFLSHPVTALLLNIGGMFALYLTPLYKHSLTNICVHIGVHLHFLLAGYVFVWSIAGPDGAPKRPGFMPRLTVIFLAIASHGMLSKLMYAGGFPRGTSHPLPEIQEAAKIMYYGGDLAELILLVILFAGLFRQGAAGSKVFQQIDDGLDPLHSGAGAAKIR